MKVTIKYTTGDSDVLHTLKAGPSLVDAVNAMLRLESDPDAPFSDCQIVSITITNDEVKYVSSIALINDEVVHRAYPSYPSSPFRSVTSTSNPVNTSSERI